MALPDVAIGAIGAACIAALLSFLGLVASKEQKTSEFRQAWIDAVREDISLVISSAHAIYLEIKASNGDTKLAWPNIRANLLAANTATARLRLRLNNDEDLSRQILVYLTELEDLLIVWDVPGLEKIEQQLVAITDRHLPKAAAKMLKIEWKRVKAGEPIFRISKWLALAVVIGLIAFALMRLF